MSNKEQDRYQKTIKGLLQQYENRQCFSCLQKGPNYLVVPFSIYVCTYCSALFRKFNYRVKGVSISNFTEEEVNELKQGGNGVGRAKWLARWNPEEYAIPAIGQEERILKFIRLCFQDRRWIGEKLPPTEPLEKLVGKDLPPLQVGGQIQAPGHQQPKPAPIESDWDPFSDPRSEPQPPPKQEKIFDPFAMPAGQPIQPLQPQQIPAVQPIQPLQPHHTPPLLDQGSLLGAPTQHTQPSPLLFPATTTGATGGSGATTPAPSHGNGYSTGLGGVSVGSSDFRTPTTPATSDQPAHTGLAGLNFGGTSGTTATAGVSAGLGNGMNGGVTHGAGAGAGAGAGVYGGFYPMPPGAGWPQYGMMPGMMMIPGGGAPPQGMGAGGPIMMMPGMMMATPPPGMMATPPPGMTPGMPMGPGVPMMMGGWGVPTGPPSGQTPTALTPTQPQTQPPKPDPFADLSF